jgi:hypothetical protein
MPPIKYGEYADMPWARNQLLQIDWDEKHHQDYVSGTVAPWLQQALTNLTGVAPGSPGLNTAMQSQYMANVQGAVGGAYGAAAAATPMNPQSTMAGGIVASPTAYLSNAAREGAVGRSSGALQAAQVQASLNTMQPNTQAQGYAFAIADLMNGLPAVYAQRRAETRSNIEQFKAELEQAQQEAAFEQAKFAEDMRHNRVQESTSAMNAQTNAAIQLGRLGIDAQGQAFDQTNTNADNARASAADEERARHNQATEAAAQARIAASRAAKTAKPMTPTAISSMQGKWKRPINSPPKLGPGWKQPVWDPGTKAWYAKKAPAGTTKEDKENVREALDKFYFDKIDGKLEPEPAARRVANFILARKNRFVLPNGKVDAKAISRLLAEVIGGSIPPLVRDLIANHVGPNGRWR